MTPMTGMGGKRLQEELERELLDLPGVVGVSYKDNSQKIIVYLEAAPDRPGIPTSMAGVPVETRVIGRVIALAQSLPAVNPYRMASIFTERSERYRPAPGGCSVGHYRITAGTLGVVCKNGEILSNNHVLANSNGAVKGDVELQPGPHDGGKRPEDEIADLDRFVYLEEETNYVDAAVAVPDSPGLVTREILGIGQLWGWTEAQENMEVWKSGRTTGLTKSYVVDINATVKVNYDFGIATFSDQVFIDSSQWAFGAAGDSGSLIVTRIGGVPYAVALLFAGSDTIIVGCKIGRVIQELNIDLGTHTEWVPPSPLTMVAGMIPLGLVGGVIFSEESKRR